MAWKYFLFCKQHCHGLLEIRVDLLLETHFVGISERESTLFKTHEKLLAMKCSKFSSRVKGLEVDVQYCHAAEMLCKTAVHHTEVAHTLTHTRCSEGGVTVKCFADQTIQ